MKKFRLVFVAVLLSLCSSAWAHKETYSVRQKSYRLSTVFELDKEGHPLGSVWKSVFRIRTNYDVYDDSGEHEATGIARIWCLGTFRPWGAEFDVYDRHGDRIGVIDGQVATTEAAKYSFYNSQGEKVGIAYLDLTCAGFSILDPEKDTKIIARLTRNFVEDQVDHWDVVVYEHKAIDPALIKVFAAFAVDKQAYFKADN